MSVPLRYRFWRFLHVHVNGVAWRYVGSPYFDNGRLAAHPIWRLNGWLADRWVPWWVRQTRDREADR